MKKIEFRNFSLVAAIIFGISAELVVSNGSDLLPVFPWGFNYLGLIGLFLFVTIVSRIF